MPEQTILRVAVPAPLHRLFDYLSPIGVDARAVAPGVRVRVPFGRGERCGVVMQVVAGSRQEPGRLKRVAQILDTESLLSSSDLTLISWAAGYYQHPIGEVAAGVLPVRLRQGRPALGGGHPGWRVTDAGQMQDVTQLTRAPRQAELLGLLQAHPGGLAGSFIRERCGECGSALQGLRQKGWIERAEVAVAMRVGKNAAALERPPTLGSEQQHALQEINDRLGGFSAILLEGVTGSGKTEVYLGAVQQALESGCQILILVPEIGLTPQLVARFQRRLDVPLALLHSGLSHSQRELAWQQARRGEAQVVIGTRSAVFTPLPALGLVIVDEEHDISLKQQDGFRYSARDLAVVRAQRTGCPVVLGSATPSLESLRNALDGRYAHLHLTRRAGGASPPRVDLLDIRSAPLQAGVSSTLLRMTGEELEAGNQVLLFLNRRGYAPILTCYDCGWVAQCRRCDARMTLHQGRHLLWCHHCGSQRPLDPCCPDCGGTQLRPLGQGTERLEEALLSCFADAGLVRIDRDSTQRRGSMERLLQEIRRGEHRLLIGTQMLAKGHHFPDVTLVGVLDVDQGLFGADFRAAERMAQMITQVAGRAGRAEKPGRVVIQTRHPDHPLMQTLLRQGYGAFARESLIERRAAGLPPYSHQALLRAESHHADEPALFLEQALDLARRQAQPGMEFWGPVPAPMERRAGRFRAHLLIQAEQRGQMQQLLSAWIPEMAGEKFARRVRWSIDVDPQEMF